MNRTTYRVELAYDGTAFAGFARQPDAETVESVLRLALRPVVPALSPLSPGGRTDRGVHATGQVVSFFSRERCPLGPIADAIDAARPGALAALDVRIVSNSFHARWSATERAYVYLWPDDGSVDVRRVDRLLAPLVGTRCFSAFARDTPRGKSTVRSLRVATARAMLQDGVPFVRFDLTASGFLRRMVRVLVATAIEAARSGEPDDALLRRAELGDRRLTSIPARPEGLTLTRIAYPPR
jgi:tRNA pseudouridine38-40 synthase